MSTSTLPVHTARVAKKHCHAMHFCDGPWIWVVYTTHPCTRPMLVFDRPIRIFLKYFAAVAADNVTSFIEAASSCNLLFDMPINHCLLLSLTWPAMPPVICCHCRYDITSHTDDTGQPHWPSSQPENTGEYGCQERHPW